MKSELQAPQGLHDPVVCHLPHMSQMIWDAISTLRSATRTVQSPPVNLSSVLVDFMGLSNASACWIDGWTGGKLNVLESKRLGLGFYTLFRTRTSLSNSWRFSNQCEGSSDANIVLSCYRSLYKVLA